MRFLRFGLLVAVLLCGVSFAALSSTEKECMRGCCESVGGTYEWEHNGCDSPQGDMSGCADSCLQKRTGSACPLFALLATVGAAAFAYGKK